MRKLFWGIVVISLLFGGMSRAATGEQKPVSPFSVFDLPVMQDIYRFDDLLHDMPYVYAQIDFLLAKQRIYEHASAPTGVVFARDTDTLVSLLKSSDSFDQFVDKVRIDFVKYLLAHQYSQFITQPYIWDANEAIVLQSWDYTLMKPIFAEDGLDVLLSNKLSWFADHFTNIKRYLPSLAFISVTIDSQEYANLWAIYLFKTEQDLRDLWYKLISWKTRANVDKEYRRYNIMTAFKNIGNVRLIMPGETFNLAREIHYTPYNGNADYVSGYATFGAGARMVYGGWLCGVATALYQGSLTNLGFQLLEYSAHSTYYRNLFNAEINGTRVSTPGLDATIYAPNYNLQFKNIRDYPIVTVFNFGGGESDPEQVFTLSKPQDKGSFEFVWSRGMCFTWNINGQLRTNCYEYIKNF